MMCPLSSSTCLACRHIRQPPGKATRPLRRLFSNCHYILQCYCASLRRKSGAHASICRSLLCVQPQRPTPLPPSFPSCMHTHVMTSLSAIHALFIVFFAVTSFLEISALHQIQRGSDPLEFVPQLAREISYTPAQNRHYSSSARGDHPCGGPTGIGRTLRQVLVRWGMKSVTNSSRYNAQRDKLLLRVWR